MKEGHRVTTHIGHELAPTDLKEGAVWIKRTNEKHYRRSRRNRCDNGGTDDRTYIIAAIVGGIAIIAILMEGGVSYIDSRLLPELIS